VNQAQQGVLPISEVISMAEPNPRKVFSPDQIRAGIARLHKRIGELNELDVEGLYIPSTDVNPIEVSSIEFSIRKTLSDLFDGNDDYYAFLYDAPFLSPVHYPNAIENTNIYRSLLKNNVHRATIILKNAISHLEEELPLDTPSLQEQHKRPDEPPRSQSRSVFIVHGHDDGAREAVARFLERIGFKAIILHEQANQGRTVIEKVERHGDVGFAVVLLTPDDEGGVKGGQTHPRARQNVIMELGYFIGRLGRGHVCALKRGEVELPSDFGGVVYETFDGSGGWKHALGRELEGAGYEINWNMVMRS
jgi:hypothetical protein